MVEAAKNLPDALISIIMTALQTERGVHAETAIATIAAFTGEYALRCSGHDLSHMEMGTPISSDRVNELLFEGENSGQLTISDVFINALFSLGIDVSKESWPEFVPEENQLLYNPLEVVAHVRHAVEETFNTAQVEPIERAYACAQATAQLVAQTRRVLDPHIGKALALESMLRGAKTVPFVLA